MTTLFNVFIGDSLGATLVDGFGHLIQNFVTILVTFEGLDCSHLIRVFHDRVHFKPEFTSRGLKKWAKSCLLPLGIELTTLTITRAKAECLNWSLCDAPFQIWKIIKACLMYILSQSVKFDLIMKKSGTFVPYSRVFVVIIAPANE